MNYHINCFWKPHRKTDLKQNDMAQKILRLLYKPYKWLVVIPVLAVSTAFFGSMAVLLCYFLPPKLASLICGVTWSKLNSYVTPMFVSISGRENIDKNQSYVVISNHQSHYDIFVLYGWLGIDIKWVMKADLRKVPFLGFSCERLQHIYIDRSNTEAALASINEAKKRIVNGTSVIFFPEGTRSDTGEMRSFKKGAFRFAVDLGLPLLPITIVGTREILPKGTLNLFPGKARMIIHPPIAVKGYSHENLSDLMEKARTMIQSAIPSEK